MEWSFRSEGEVSDQRARDLITRGPLLSIIVKSDTTKMKTMALIDTGASICVIKPKLAKKLSLQITNETKVSGVSPHGQLAHGQAKIGLGILQLENPVYEFPAELVIADFSINDPSLGILLGRPFLKHFDLLYEGSHGRYRLTASTAQSA